jgi:hypothetical protein
MPTCRRSADLFFQVQQTCPRSGILAQRLESLRLESERRRHGDDLPRLPRRAEKPEDLVHRYASELAGGPRGVAGRTESLGIDAGRKPCPRGANEPTHRSGRKTAQVDRTLSGAGHDLDQHTPSLRYCPLDLGDDLR